MALTAGDDAAVAPAVVRAAVIQTAPVLGDVAGNLDRCLAQVRAAAAAGCRLVVFPECALSGYMFDDAGAAWQCAEPVPGASTEALARACAQHDVHCVIGLLERADERLHNTAVLIGPHGLIGRYRKAHIACVGADCFTVPGTEPFAVHETALGRRLAEARAAETMVVADLDLSLARAKTKAPGEGGYHVRLFDDRRPELYGPLCR